MNQTKPDILAIGSVLWDVIGRATTPLDIGSDVPGRIIRIPGGVAMNIAMTLRRFGLIPAVLSAVGRDAEGDELVAETRRLGLVTDYLYRSDDLPTDRYMAVEGANGLIAAIADAHSLEAAGAKILTPLEDGRLGSAAAPYDGAIALDGNLTTALLRDIAQSPVFAAADLRVAPASPGKAERLVPLLDHPRATIYLNRGEAELICLDRFESSAKAADALIARGAARVLVTDGGNPATLATQDKTLTRTPRAVMVTRVTGAGDTFMAAHIAAELRGEDDTQALDTALEAAARYVTGEHPQ
ncbi:kinase [Actibacterium mucosum KCTC 23349]|uniref:Kinase n=1 Tax=Actibacterium mucosum KCTC 23349 TaxID=1454373 RepID=A0A037ZME2_9RHOB|nr:PfkB family carbohydrate kinase [Actibacterium mucosum]KAJ56814.1 kinase [Actibacterium mucosum KCTC 23349]